MIRTTMSPIGQKEPDFARKDFSISPKLSISKASIPYPWHTNP